jgi:hypothetical protein
MAAILLSPGHTIAGQTRSACSETRTTSGESFAAASQAQAAPLPGRLHQLRHGTGAAKEPAPRLPAFSASAPATIVHLQLIFLHLNLATVKGI